MLLIIKEFFYFFQNSFQIIADFFIAEAHYRISLRFQPLGSESIVLLLLQFVVIAPIYLYYKTIISAKKIYNIIPYYMLPQKKSASLSVS